MYLAQQLTAIIALALPAAAQTCLAFPTAQQGLDLWLADDDHRTVVLPFGFPFAGGPIRQISVCSNGFVWLGPPPSIDPNDFSCSEAELLGRPSRIALCWNDWNPELGGRIRYYSSADQVSVVWRDVPSHANPQVLANMEVVLAASGQIDLHFAATMDQPTSPLIVGVSAGHGADAAAVDWSALPVVRGATAHQLFATDFDLRGTTTSLIPTTALDYGSSRLPLGACQSSAPPQFASAVGYGHGCPTSGPGKGSCYEQFAGGSFDLSQASWRLQAQGGNRYLLLPGGSFDSSYRTSDQRVQGDDTQVTVSLASMGGFPFLGRQHATAAVCSNGYLWMAPGGNNDSTASVAELTASPPRIAPFWADWNFAEGGPGAGGKFYWTATPSYCLATWENVAAAGQPGSQNTFQARLHKNGDIEFLYGHAVNDSLTNGGLAIVGLSAGAGAADPGSVDLSGARGLLIDLTWSGPLRHTADAAPRLGATYQLALQPIAPSSPMTLLGVGLRQTRIDLQPLGLPGCSQLGSYDLLILTLPIAGRAGYGLPIPFEQQLIGTRLYSQGATLAPSGQLAGLAMSNGLQGTIGW